MAFAKILDRAMERLSDMYRKKHDRKWIPQADPSSVLGLGLDFDSKIDLEQVDPQAFETLCAEVLGKYYNAEVDNIQYANDRGRDLIVHLSAGDMFVECKHWEGTVGRPVVQKLDSAVNHEGAIKGMIVTTGQYSKAAVDYAAECSPPIVLVDLAELQRIASTVGFDLTVGEAEGTPEYYCRTSPTDRLYGYVRGGLDDDIESYPEPAGALMEPWRRTTEYRAYYLVSYRVDAKFSTAARPDLFFINDEGKVLVDVENRTLVDDRQLIADILSRSAEKRELPQYATVRDPRAVQTTVTDAVAELVADKYTETVGYTGRNGHYYAKTCRPSNKDIAITGLTKIMVADTSIGYRILGTEYSRELMDIDGAERWGDSPHSECGICGKEISRKPMLCTICGRTVHRSLLKSHGVECSECGRTMCVECARRYRRFALNRAVCPSCLAAIESQDAEIDYAIDSSAGIDCDAINPPHLI